MRTPALVAMALTGLLSSTTIAAATLQIKDLPAAVQKTVREQTAKAEVKSIARESDGGKTVYEVETIVDGRSRDLLIDAHGTVVEVEQQVALEDAPEAVQAVLRAQGAVSKLESVTRGTTTTYEAKVRDHGKERSLTLDASGKPIGR